MRAELTYAFNGGVLGVELPAGGHGRDGEEGAETLATSHGLDVLAAVKGAVVGWLFGGWSQRADTLPLTWMLRVQSVIYRPSVQALCGCG